MGVKKKLVPYPTAYTLHTASLKVKLRSYIINNVLAHGTDGCI